MVAGRARGGGRGGESTGEVHEAMEPLLLAYPPLLLCVRWVTTNLTNLAYQRLQEVATDGLPYAAKESFLLRQTETIKN